MGQTSNAFTREVADAIQNSAGSGQKKRMQDAIGAALPNASYQKASGASFALLPEHNGAILELTHTADISVVIPTSLDLGFSATFVQGGAGQIVFSVPAGSTLKQVDTLTKTRKVDAMASILVIDKTTPNITVRLFGDLA